MIDEEWAYTKTENVDLPAQEVARVRSFFSDPHYENLPAHDHGFEIKRFEDPLFGLWAKANLATHKNPGYVIANISLKPIGGAPGDATSAQMEALADLADKYSMGEIRVTHEQNLVFADVRKRDVYALWHALNDIQLGHPQQGSNQRYHCVPGLGLLRACKHPLDPGGTTYSASLRGPQAAI